MFAADAIEYQVINGKNNMPAFGGRLSEDQITDAAYYVVYQSQEGWNKKPLYVSECSPQRQPSPHAALPPFRARAPSLRKRTPALWCRGQITRASTSLKA